MESNFSDHDGIEKLLGLFNSLKKSFDEIEKTATDEQERKNIYYMNQLLSSCLMNFEEVIRSQKNVQIDALSIFYLSQMMAIYCGPDIFIEEVLKFASSVSPIFIDKATELNEANNIANFKSAIDKAKMN